MKMATVLTPEALAAQRETLFNQQQQATIQQAQQSAMGQRAQLNQSISAARQDYQQARLQAQEGFYQRNRDVLTATSMRGLADSGQANIAQVQSQTAYGETISGLYGQKQAVEQQAVTQRQMIEQNLAAVTTEANLQRGRQQLESDTQLFQQVQAIDDNRKAQVIQLMQLAETGEYTGSQLKAYADAYGVTEEDLTTILNASRYFDPTGGLDFKERFDWDEVGDTTLAGGSQLGLIGLGVGLLTGVLKEFAAQWAKTRTVSGDGVEFSGTGAEIITQVNQYYSGFEGSDQISAAIDPSFLGQNDRVVFKYKGQTFNTYNEALAAYRASR